MIKHFCDSCGHELNNGVPDIINPRFRGKIDDWEFNIIQSYKGISNIGNLCKPCFRMLLIQAVDEYNLVKIEIEATGGIIESKEHICTHDKGAILK